MRYSRCRDIFGEDGFSRLSEARVLILGVGGVGSFVLDCLYRSGLRDITIVDCDIYEESNRNRQIGADGAVGECKVSTLSSLYPGVESIHCRMDREWAESFDFDPYDVVVDAVDTTSVKLAVAKRCYRKLIMSMGSARRMDPTRIKVASVWKSQGDALARKIRNSLKKERFDRNFTVVFSDEQPVCDGKGSFVAVTGAFGLFICAETVKKILNSTQRRG